MKLKTKSLLSFGILIFLVALLIYYIYQNIQDFQSLTIVNPLFLIILILLFIFLYFLGSIITKNILYPLGVYLRGGEAFALSVVTGFYNLITPFRGGAIVRAGYLKKKHNFSYIDFLATLSASYVLIFLVASFLGLLSTYLIYLSEGIFSWILFLIFLGIFIPLLLTVIFSPRIPETKNNFINRFIKIINGWNLIKNNKRVIITITFVSFLQILILAFILYLQFRVFGIEIEFIKCLFLTSIASIGILVAITPANLGVGEVVTVFSALTIGITPVQSLSATLLGRAVSFLVLFILGPIFSYTLLKNKSNKNAPKN